MFSKKIQKNILFSLSVCMVIMFLANFVTHFYLKSNLNFSSPRKTYKQVPNIDILMSKKKSNFFDHEENFQESGVKFTQLENPKLIGDNPKKFKKMMNSISSCEYEDVPHVWPTPLKLKANIKNSLISLFFTEIEFSIFDLKNSRFLSWNENILISKSLSRFSKSLFKKKNDFNDQKIETLRFFINIKSISNDIIESSLSTDDQSYSFLVLPNNEVILEASSIVSMLYGLESFRGLCKKDAGRIKIEQVPILIKDKPKYRWRGIMIELSKNFISIRKIMEVIDGMVLNKMNILHLKLSGEHFFPVKFENFKFSTSHENAVYEKNELVEIVKYAYFRGIRVIPDLQFPFSIGSIGRVFIHKECYEYENKYVLDVNNPKSIEMMSTILKEIRGIFIDDYLYLSNKYIPYESVCSYLTKREIKRMFDVLEENWDGKIIYSPCEDIKNYVTLSNTIHKCQFLRGNDVIIEGIDVINSIDWRLDTSNPDTLECDSGIVKFLGDEWRIIDDNEFLSQGNKEIIGGEGILLGDVINDNTIVQTLFPKASVIAGKLWSVIECDTLSKKVVLLMNHVCLMINNGISSSAVEAGHCLHDTNIRYYEPISHIEYPTDKDSIESMFYTYPWHVRLAFKVLMIVDKCFYKIDGLFVNEMVAKTVREHLM